MSNRKSMISDLMAGLIKKTLWNEYIKINSIFY